MKKFTVFFIMVLFSLTILLSGCQGEELIYDPNHKYPQQLTVRLMSRDIYQNDGLDITRDKVVEFIEKKFNIKLEFIYIPSPTQTEVFDSLNRMILTNDMPDIFEMRNDMPTAIQIYESLIKNKRIVDVKKFIEGKEDKYPTIHSILQKPEVNTGLFLNKDGILGMVPRPIGIIDHGIIIRQDWLELPEINLPLPTNYLEFFEAMKRFVEVDPEGMNACGITLPNTWWWGHFYVGFTGANTWAVVEDGKGGYDYKYALATEGQKQCYKYLYEMYKNNYMDKDVLTMSGENDAINKFIAGKAGATMMSVTYGAPVILKELKKTNPNAKIAFLTLDGPAAKMQMYMPELFEGFAINSNFPDVDRLFDLAEYLMSEEGQQLLIYGLEGIHYTEGPNGEKIINEDLRKQEGWLGRKHGITGLFNVVPHIDKDFYEDYEALIEYREKLALPNAMVANPLLGIQTAAEKEVGSRPWDVASKYTLGFITGKMNIDNLWDEFVYEFYKQGMTKIEKEVNEKFEPVVN